VQAVATSEDVLVTRLQTAWDEHVQMVWMKPCLTVDLLHEFRDLWQAYTAPSEDRRSTKLRKLNHNDAASAIERLIAFATKVAVAAASSGGERLATLADLA